MPQKKKKDKDKEKLQKLHEKFGISMKVLRVAREVGLSCAQLEKWTDEEKLKQTIIGIKPAMATRFVERPRPSEKVAPEPTFESAVAAFDVLVLAGGPPRQRVMSEDRDIDVQIKKRGITNIQSINILRSMKADANNRFHSTVTVKYKKQV
jgi:hypothetical protein